MSGDKPFLVKGIQSVHDARKAVELGVDGIVCELLRVSAGRFISLTDRMVPGSNHAGRQVDGAGESGLHRTMFLHADPRWRSRIP